MKHLDDEPFGGGAFSSRPAQQGYQAPAPMMGGGLGGVPEKPQFATFEVGRNGLAVEPKAALSEDALPPMPSWDTASKKHVADEEKDAVELGELDPVTGQKMPLMTGAAATGISGPPSPAIGGSPYGARPGQANGYVGVPGDQYGQNQAAFDGNGRGYGQPDIVGAARPYGAPRPGDRQQRGEYGGRGQGRGYDNGGRGYNGQGRGYGEPTSPQDPYAPQEMYADNAGFVTPAAEAYGRPQPGREYSNENRPFAPPSNQYPNDLNRPLNAGRPGYPAENFPPRGPPRGPPRNGSPAQNNNGFDPSRGPPRGPPRNGSPALNNNSGFDFGGGEQPYRRGSPATQQPYGSNSNLPAQQSYNSRPGRRPSPPAQQEDILDDYYGGSTTAPPSYATRSPPPREEAAYPGYRPYQSSSSRGNGGRGGGREPQRWDPVQQ
jgi:hypothetical protein